MTAMLGIQNYALSKDKCGWTYNYNIFIFFPPPPNSIPQNSDSERGSHPTQILNLLSIILMEIQLKVLEKGLSFCPTPPELDMEQIFKGINKFFHTLRVKLSWTDPGLGWILMTTMP